MLGPFNFTQCIQWIAMFCRSCREEEVEQEGKERKRVKRRVLTWSLLLTAFESDRLVFRTLHAASIFSLSSYLEEIKMLISTIVPQNRISLGH